MTRSKTKEQLNAAESELLEQQALATQLGKSKPKQWRSKTSTSEKTVDSVKGQVAGTQAKIEALKTRLRRYSTEDEAAFGSGSAN